MSIIYVYMQYVYYCDKAVTIMNPRDFSTTKIFPNNELLMASKQYIISIDQGTSSSRCIVFNQCGEIVAHSQREHSQYYPAPGHVEHNVEEIWESTKLCIANAMDQSKLKASDLGAVGITNQRETTVVWNK